MDQIRHFCVQGRVQGVWYRSWCQETARTLHIKGFVRNRQNGQVEVYAVGLEEVLDLFVSKCKQGPLLARVDKITPAPSDGQDTVQLTDDFLILGTK